jgi:hypothetical protein
MQSFDTALRSLLSERHFSLCCTYGNTEQYCPKYSLKNYLDGRYRLAICPSQSRTFCKGRSWGLRHSSNNLRASVLDTVRPIRETCALDVVSSFCTGHDNGEWRPLRVLSAETSLSATRSEHNHTTSAPFPGGQPCEWSRGHARLLSCNEGTAPKSSSDQIRKGLLSHTPSRGQQCPRPHTRVFSVCPLAQVSKGVTC